jgi:hypothetical protein
MSKLQEFIGSAGGRSVAMALVALGISVSPSSAQTIDPEAPYIDERIGEVDPQSIRFDAMSEGYDKLVELRTAMFDAEQSCATSLANLDATRTRLASLASETRLSASSRLTRMIFVASEALIASSEPEIGDADHPQEMQEAPSEPEAHVPMLRLHTVSSEMFGGFEQMVQAGTDAPGLSQVTAQGIYKTYEPELDDRVFKALAARMDEASLAIEASQLRGAHCLESVDSVIGSIAQVVSGTPTDDEEIANRVLETLAGSLQEAAPTPP